MWPTSDRFLLGNGDTIMVDDMCWSSKGPHWTSHGWKDKTCAEAKQFSFQMGRTNTIYFARLKPKQIMKPTSTPLRVPVTITIPDVERLVMLAELLDKLAQNPNMTRTGPGCFTDFNMWYQVTNGLNMNGLNWRTWEPTPQPTPITINVEPIKISDGGYRWDALS